MDIGCLSICDGRLQTQIILQLESILDDCLISKTDPMFQSTIKEHDNSSPYHKMATKS